MTTINNINPALFVDQENVTIPYSAATLQLNSVIMQRDTTPFSNIGSGKFRRLFNRHVPAFRR
uniref:Uncharacterized protein n=1 Tax=Roseihalotalea indica TaxID=2867963 RepID=A0AA49JHW5_9BACT|nr:hypothetical protein K4G66_09725 [Tunicatimonas sp. TK19036]